MTARMYGLGILGATLLTGCWPSFPEELLRVDASAFSDLGPRDGGDDGGLDATMGDTGNDASIDRGGAETSPMDVGDTGPRLDANDAGPGDASDAATDVPVDVGRDVFMLPPDADVCTMFTLPEGVTAERVVGDLDGAIDLAFDPSGRVAVAFADRVVSYNPGGMSTPVVSSLPGTPVAIRYTRQGTLVVAYNIPAPPSDAGVSDGGSDATVDPDASTDAGVALVGRIGVLVAGGSNLANFTLTGIGRIGGLAIDREDRIWFTEASGARLMRVQPNGTMLTQVYAFPCGGMEGLPVCTPGHLAFGPGEQSLLVGSAAAVNQAVVRLPLTPPDGGMGPATVDSAARPTSVLSGFTSISGLTADECGNVYVTDAARMDVVRILGREVDGGSNLGVLSRGVTAARGLAFGNGMGFDDRAVFFLAGEPRSLWSALAVARGASRSGTPMHMAP